MRRLLGALLGALLVVALPVQAGAEVRYVTTWTDPPGDAARAADIVKVTSTDGIGVRADVTDLGSAGTFRVLKTAESWRYVVVVSKATGQAPRAAYKRSTRNADGSWAPWQALNCAVRPTWDAVNDFVTAGYSQECRPEFVYEGDLASASLTAGASTDSVPLPPREGTMIGSNTFTDPVGDAAPRADLRTSTETYTDGAVWVTSRLTDLGDSGRFRAFLSASRSWDLRVVVTKEAGQQPVPVLIAREINYEESDVGQWHRVPCSMVVRWYSANPSNTVSVQVPRRCYEGLQHAWFGIDYADFTAGDAYDRINYWR